MHSSQRIYTYTCDVHKFFKLFEKNDESFKVQIHENESEKWKGAQDFHKKLSKVVQRD